MKLFFLFLLIPGSVVHASALDRQAFTFTKYDLDVRVEPEQQRLGVRGRVTLRNDSSSPQKDLALQISSTLDWKAIQLEGKPLEFTSHIYTSDIDHSGVLSEAVVILPHEVPPKSTVELDVGYEGVIPLDATRLTRIGVPEDKAKHSDWDQISKAFTAVRGIGYVIWYPVATEAANLSEGNSVEETVARWKTRQVDTTMQARFESSANNPILFSGNPSMVQVREARSIDDRPVEARSAKADSAFSMVRLGVSVPTFVIANYQKLAAKDSVTIQYLPGQEEAAKDYAEIAAQIDPIVPVSHGSEGLQILGLPDADALPFVTEGMLLTPLALPMTNEAELNMVYAKARDLASSPRAWIQEGLAHYAQAEFIETQHGRQAALDYLKAHESLLVEAEKRTLASGEPTATNSLINAPDDLYLQTKAMYVWRMLKDMLGNSFADAMVNYRADEDTDAAYLQRIVEKSTHRDLEWFFGDWVYRDRGLPDFRVDSVYPRPMVDGGFMVTVTIENLGGAGAEVPVTLRIVSGAITKRLEVRGKSKASVRMEAGSTPLEVVVNDGSVPESDMSNNTYKIESMNH